MKLRKRTLVGSPSSEVTQREIDNRKLVREAAAESFVLLKNENNLLPLAEGARLGLYGAGAIKTMKGGTGSGDVNERDNVNIYQGLLNAGFEITSKRWLDSYQKVYEKSREDWKQCIIDVPVRYGFGFGLSYTTFSISSPNVTLTGLGTENPTLTAEVEVTNTGEQYSGKEVVQVYVSCPQQGLP